MMSGDRMFGRTIIVHMFICIDDTLFTGSFRLEISIGREDFKEEACRRPATAMKKNELLYKLNFVSNIASGRRG